jgi:hypothetical protein
MVVCDRFPLTKKMSRATDDEIAKVQQLSTSSPQYVQYRHHSDHIIVGSSSVADAIGVGFGTQETFLNKLLGFEQPVSNSAQFLMQRGIRYEPLARLEYTRHMQSVNRAVTVSDGRLAIHPDHKWLVASNDGMLLEPVSVMEQRLRSSAGVAGSSLVTGRSDVEMYAETVTLPVPQLPPAHPPVPLNPGDTFRKVVVEIKVTSRQGGYDEFNRGTVPAHYYPQLQLEMGLHGAHYADFVVLNLPVNSASGPAQLRVQRIKFNQEYFNALVAQLTKLYYGELTQRWEALVV